MSGFSMSNILFGYIGPFSLEIKGAVCQVCCLKNSASFGIVSAT